MPNMPALPSYLKRPAALERVGAFLSHNLNFYRVHMLCFTFIPLIISGIFYGANGQHKVPYLDCLFLCMSSMCVTGLTTYDLSHLTTFQQFLMYFQMLIGSLIFVSILMIWVRMHFFRVQFQHVVEKARQQRRDRRGSFNLSKTITRLPTMGTTALRRRFTRRPDEGDDGDGDANGFPTGTTAVPTTGSGRAAKNATKKGRPGKLSKDMIKRIDGGGVGLVNPMGWYDAAIVSQGTRTPVSPPNSLVDDPPAPVDSDNTAIGSNGAQPIERAKSVRSEPSIKSVNSVFSESVHSHVSEPGTNGSTTDGSKRMGSHSPLDSPRLPYANGIPLRQVTTNDSDTNNRSSLAVPSEAAPPTPYSGKPVEEDLFPRSRTIAFEAAEDNFDHELHFGTHRDTGGFMPRTATMRSENRLPYTATMTSGPGFPRTYSMRPTQSRRPKAKETGFGGFPTPLRMIQEVFPKLFPGASKKLSETLTMQRTNTVLSGRGASEAGSKEVPYISFSAIVGRNSHFHDLTEEQMDELGGVEYRALKVLLVIVVSYWLFLPLIGATIVAPYLAAGGRHDTAFNENETGQEGLRIPWFTFFQMTSAFSNTGASLVDASMVPFQSAYGLIVVTGLLILAGNTCFPILLRFIIWVLWRITPATYHLHETLTFLLDHPRRCFVYLFPSTHTWFLALVVLILTAIDWISFIVLDKGNPAIEDIPVGPRVVAGWFQSVAVRAAGFAIVNMNALAPAVKVLYVIMMYISVYPIAMSVRATNVYEERSLGLFEENDDDDEEDALDGMPKEGATAVAKYLGWHARRQLAFDMWWIAGALWIICIIERTSLSSPENYEWMNIFNLTFEIVSAYGTVGLSLGLPYDNYSLSGGLRKLSKLVLIIVMLRGRHRGLPVAIDRAVMLPKDFTKEDEQLFEDRLRRSRSRRDAMSDADYLSQTGSMFPRTFTGASMSQPPMAMSHLPQSSPPTNAATMPSSPRLPQRRDSSPSALRRVPSHQMSVNSGASPVTPTVGVKNDVVIVDQPGPGGLFFAVPRGHQRAQSFGGTTIQRSSSFGPTTERSPSFGPTTERSPSFGITSVASAPAGPPAGSPVLPTFTSGALTPVDEGSRSRRATITDEPEEI